MDYLKSEHLAGSRDRAHRDTAIRVWSAVERMYTANLHHCVPQLGCGQHSSACELCVISLHEIILWRTLFAGT